MKTFILHHVEYQLESIDRRQEEVTLMNSVNSDLLVIDISDLYWKAIQECTTYRSEEGSEYDQDAVEETVTQNLECFISENISKALVVHP